HVLAFRRVAAARRPPHDLCRHRQAARVARFCRPPRGDLHSFPTRRSSDLSAVMRSSSTNTSAIPFSAPNRISSWGRLSTIQVPMAARSEEHTSELQSRFDLVCRLLLEKKKNKKTKIKIQKYKRH